MADPLPSRLFLYGTLLAGSAGPVARRLHDLLGPGLPATVPGRLYAVADPAGWYPALLPDPGGGIVHGMVHRAGARFGHAALAQIDRYEDCRMDDPPAGEYIRRAIAVTVSDAVLDAAAYLYNRPLPAGARLLPDGDFRAFLAATGLPAYCALPSG